MPLSDEEMRLLEQMERALVEEDPKFASTLRGTRFARATRARIAVASVAFIIGVALLMTGAVMGDRVGIVVGIVGFVLMLASATIGLAAWRGRQSAPEQGGPADAAAGDSPNGLSVLQGGKSARRSKRSSARESGRGTGRKPRTNGTFMQRFEQRWQRRRDQNGGF